VFLAGIKTQLKLDTHLDLITIEPGNPEAAECIRRARPRAVLFDLAAAQPDFAVNLLHDQPGLVLIGVDPSRDELLVMDSYPAQAQSLGDLIHIIEHKHPIVER
jgi:hypothetical protein